MFVDKAWSIPKSGAPEMCFNRVSSSLFCKHYIMLDLPGTITEAYYEHLQITPAKSFITLRPGVASGWSEKESGREVG
jgi:hypothetical protein